MLKKYFWISLLVVLIGSTPAYMQDDNETAAQKFVDLLVAKDYETAILTFDPKMKEVLPVGKLRELWESILSQCGPFKGQAGVRKQAQQQYTIVFVTGVFEKAVLDIQVVYNDQNEISGLFFAPGELPKDANKNAGADSLPRGLTEQAVAIKNQDWTLPGTLTLPAGKGPFPVVILVHGSGPNDRDETVGPNKPFRDLAWGLAKRGVAVFRYEKRTKVYGNLAFKDKVTVQEETIDDVLAGITLLRNRKEINSKQIFILGHSLGGMLIPRIGTQGRDVRGFIVMAGSCRPLEDLILEQSVYLASLDGNTSAEEQTALDLIRKQVANVKSADLSSSTPATDLPLNSPASYWLDLRDYNPALVAQNVKKPFLILQGERDYQVPVTDYNIWKEKLSKRKDVEFKLYPELNHLFIPGEGKPNPGEYFTPGHLDEKVIKDIAGWVQRIIR